MKIVRAILIVSYLLSLFFIFSGIANAVLIVNSGFGEAGIKGFRVVSDTITFNVTSSNETISIDGQPGGCTCDKRGLYYCICTVTDEKNVATVSYAFTAGPAGSTSYPLKVDNSLGNIDTFDITSTNGNATLSYTLIDTGYNGNSECSGIGMLEVFVDGNSVNVADINVTGCTATGTMVLNVFDSGKKDVYLAVTDKIGNTKESKHKNITIDVAGPEVSDVKILNYGQELETIANNADFFVDVHFNVKEDALSSINADLSGINTNPAIKLQYKNIPVPINTCYKNTTEEIAVYQCKILAKVLRVAGSTVNISIKAKDASGIETMYVYEKTFQIDNVRPEAMITTDYCSENKCYIKNGLNKIYISLNKDNFETKQVYFSVGTYKGRVSSCTGGECFGTANVACNSGTVRAMILTAPPYKSQDDSGNPVPSAYVDLTCDNTAPLIKNLTHNCNEFGGRICTKKSEVKINAIIYEADSLTINATADYGALKNATENGICTKNSTLFNCEWIVRNPNPGFYDATVKVNITDMVGLMSSKSISFQVLDLNQDNVTPNILAVDMGSITPSGINRITLDMATRNNIPYFIFAQYNFRVLQGRNVKLLSHDINIDQCQYVDTAGNVIDARNIFSEIKVADKNIGVGDTGRIDLIFGSGGAIDANTIADSFKIYCNITAYVREDTVFYEKPQILTLEIPMTMRNSKLGTPGQAFMDKIKDSEDGFLYKLEVLGLLNNWLPKLQKICRINDYMNMAAFAGNIVSTVGNILTPAIGPGMMNGGMSFTVNIQAISECLYGGERAGNANLQGQLLIPANQQGQGQGQANFNIGVGDCSNFVKTACDFLGCKAAEKADEELDNPGSPMSNISFSTIPSYITRDADTADVSNSIYLATTTGCWPAVVYNVNKLRQIDCGYVYCLKETSLKGTDISVCDTAKSIQYCTFVTGQIFETVPFTRWAKNIGANIADMLNNIGPLAAASIAKETYCGPYMDIQKAQEMVASGEFDPTKIYVCQIPLALARFVDHRMRTARTNQFTYPDVPDMSEMAQCIGTNNCQGRPDIWSQLGGIQMTRYDQRNYEFIKEQVDQGALLSQNRMDNIHSFNDVQRLTYLSFDKKTVVDLLSPCPPDGKGTICDGKWTAPNDATPLSRQLDPKVYDVLKLDQQIKVQRDLANCGNAECMKKAFTDITGKDFDKLTDTEKAMWFSSGTAEQTKEMLKELQSINTQLGNMEEPPYELQSRRDMILFRLGFCPKAVNCANPPKEEIDKLQTKITNSLALYQAQQIGNTASMVLDILYAQHMLDWMMTGSWSTGLFRVAQFFDPDRWLNNLCNPQTRIIGPTSDTGNVVSCDAGVCRTVLTQAGERQYFKTTNNSEYYMYTIAIYIGPVYYHDLRQNINYNILFKNNAGQVLARGYRNDQLVRENMINAVQKVFLHVQKFDKMCVTFSESFPPRELILPGTSGLREYCRDIKDIDFDTGGVYVEETGEAPPTPNNPNSQPQTQTGQSPGQPGVFET